MECLRNLFNVYECEVALSPFDAANVGAVQFAEIGEFLLRHTQLLPSLAYDSAKPDSDIERTHDASYLGLTVDTSTDYEYHHSNEMQQPPARNYAQEPSRTFYRRVR